MIGETFGTREIIEPLGAGGMGEVYRARGISIVLNWAEELKRLAPVGGSL